MLKKIKKMLSGSLPTVKAIDETVATIDLAALETALTEAQQKRAGILLDGGVDEILAAERAVDEARIELERAQVALVELERRRTEAEIRDREDAFFARRDACEARRVALIELLNGDIADAARIVDEAIRELEAVETEITEISLATHKEIGTGNRIEDAKVPETFQSWLDDTEKYPSWIRGHIDRTIDHGRRHLRFWEHATA